jgi:hypothetical protein
MIEKLKIPTHHELSKRKLAVGDYWDIEDHIHLIQGMTEAKVNELIETVNALEDRITPAPDDITQH